MGWQSAEVLFERLDEELRIWNRAELEQHIYSENRSVEAREARAARNTVIRAQHDRGVELAALMELHDLSQRQIFRILEQGRSR